MEQKGFFQSKWFLIRANARKEVCLNLVDFSSVISVLTHPNRIRLLLVIRNSPEKLADISKKFNLSKPEISRHLSKMLELGVITKDVISKTYTVSVLGETLVELLSPVNFVLQNSVFFSKHIIDLPPYLYRTIDFLGEARYIEGLGNILDEARAMIGSAKDEINIMANQSLRIRATDKINQGKYILTSEMISEKDQLKNLYERIDARVLKRISHGLIIVDNKKGILNFPNLEGVIDFNSGFIISDVQGLIYLKNIFDHFWNLGTDYREI